MTEQTEIAQMLGISMTSLHRILRELKYDNPSNYKLINNKRHYNFDEIKKIIQNLRR